MYVWKATDPSGVDATLMYELRFERGRYKILEVGSPEPAFEGRGQTDLVLELGTMDHPRNFYFFLLSPSRYTRAMLSALTSRDRRAGATAPPLAALAARLPDPFWGDVILPGTDGGLEAVDVYRARPRLAGGEKARGYQVYLLDPLAAGERFSVRLGAALDDWYAKIEALAKDSWHALALRIDALASGNAELAADVDLPAVRRFIQEAEHPMHHASVEAHRACLRLVQWIGMEARPDPDGRLYVHAFPGARGTIRTHRPATGDARNEFSAIAAAWPDRRAIPTPVDLAIRNTLARLGEQDFGRDWLRHTTVEYARGATPMADGGLGILLKEVAAQPLTEPEASAGSAGAGGVADAERDVGRKRTNIGTELHGFILDELAPHMDEAYLRRTLRVFGQELDPIPGGLSGAERRAATAAAVERGRARLAEAAPGVRLRPRNVQALEAAGTVGKAVMLAVELYNLKKVTEGLSAENPVGSGLAGTSALADTAGAISKLIELVPKAMVVAKKAGGVFAVVGGTCDLIQGTGAAWDAYDRRGVSARAGGEALRATGGALTAVSGVIAVGEALAVAGGGVAATGAGVLPGAILALLGIVAQLAGSYVVAASNEVRTFLHFCRWGRRPKLIALGSAQEIGYSGDLSLLASDVMGQHQALSYVAFPFDARFELTSWGEFVLKVELTPDVDKWMGRSAVWSVEGQAWWGNEKESRWTTLSFRGFDLTSYENRSVTRSVRFKEVAPHRGLDTFVRLEGVTIRMCLGKDKRYEVTKKVRDDIDVNALLTRRRTGLAR